MYKLIKNILVIGFCTFSILSFASSTTFITNDSPQVQQALSSNEKLSFDKKIKLLTAKMKQADFSFKAIDDVKFIKALSSDVAKTPKDQQCVFDNFDRKKFNKDFDEGVATVVDAYPQYVDLYLDKLDLLISINDIFYNYPGAIEFDAKNLSASPALTIFSSEDSLAFQNIILDERYFDLRSRIGQPAQTDQGIYDFSAMKFFILGAFIYDSEKKCGLIN